MTPIAKLAICSMALSLSVAFYDVFYAEWGESALKIHKASALRETWRIVCRHNRPPQPTCDSMVSVARDIEAQHFFENIASRSVYRMYKDSPHTFGVTSLVFPFAFVLCSVCFAVKDALLAWYKEHGKEEEEEKED